MGGEDVLSLLMFLFLLLTNERLCFYPLHQ